MFFTLKVNKVGQRKATGFISVVSKAGRIEYGDKIEVKGKIEDLESLVNPGLLSYADFLNNQGINCQLRSTRSPPELLHRGGGNPLVRLSILLKNKLIVVPQKTMPEPYATLLASIVFGSKASRTPVEIKETYKRAGVAHLLVASGMHLGILIGVCLIIVRSARLPLWLAVLITTIVNFLYALMTGFGPSILRAAIMAEIMLVGLLFEREKEVYTSLSLAAFIILLFNPKCLFDVGFQLSFAATCSLVYVAPVIGEKLKAFVPTFVATTLSVAVSPVFVSVPITLFHFSQASLIGILTNIILLPWVGFIVVLGFISTVLGAIFLPLGELVNGANLILLWAADRIITALASLPFAQVFLAPPKLPIIIGYYLGLAGLVEILRRGRLPKTTKFRVAVVSLIVCSILLWTAALSLATGGLTITVLDVGQGDAILLENPSGEKILIDGAERKMGERVIVPFLQKNGIRKLDLVILTHPHEDHLGGLPPVLSKIKVEAVFDPGFNYDSQTYRRFLDLIKRNKIKYHLARAGQTIDFGKRLKGSILHPTLPFVDENVNNASVVLRLQYGEFSMLFTGDNEQEGEAKILETFPPSYLSTTILKVGHHGSSTSTSSGFLSAVNPQIAVISCGRHNKFRHPHPTTLKKLAAAGIKIYRTDNQGAIVIKTNGQTYSIAPQKSLSGSQSVQ
ncbi:MAG: DNA internalization-related competence protein ComEC/Rec2, partial [Candidatus Margulisbacteria bacterium]|nr:DNA internalization-related competence protein ComEC/Rec2 [Candidatus Margulisiibacteriota bacterium]